jgi:seryl-tRNA synthetase
VENGVIDYQKIVKAQDFYRGAGYPPVKVPWAISKKAWEITSPEGSQAYRVDDKFLVASGEQSFLEQVIKGELPYGKYQCITPCFRDEVEHTELTRPYFLKLELFDYAYIGFSEDLLVPRMIETAGKCNQFFNQYLDCRVVETETADPLAISPTYDIVSNHGIELGSYGVREHPLIGRWIYATGCAEPRLSQAILTTRG